MYLDRHTFKEIGVLVHFSPLSLILSKGQTLRKIDLVDVCAITGKKLMC